MIENAYTIPESDIRLAATIALTTHGGSAVRIVEETIADYETRGMTEQVAAWRNVAFILNEAMSGRPTPSIALH